MAQSCYSFRSSNKGIMLLLMLPGIIVAVSNNYYKPFDDKLSVKCPGCDDNRHCIVTLNGVTQEVYTLVNGSLLLSANNNDVYGEVCCGGSIKQIKCYGICPLQNERFEEPIRISSGATKIMEGKTFNVSCSFMHRPHSGITLMVNGSAARDNDLPCSVQSGSVTNMLVNYTCDALKPGVKSIEAQLSFCDQEYHSQRLIITIEEEQSITPAAVVTTSDLEKPTSLASLAVTTVESEKATVVTSDTIGTSSLTTMMTSVLATASPSLSSSSRSNDGEGGAVIGIYTAVVVTIILTISMITAISFLIYIKRRESKVCKKDLPLPPRTESTQLWLENDESLEELDNPVSAEAKECTSFQVHPPVQDQSSNIVVVTEVLHPRKEAVVYDR